MKWIFKTGAFLCVGVLPPSMTYAIDEAAELAEMMESSVRDVCRDTAFMKCANIASKTCESNVNSIIEQCKSKLPKKLPKNGLADQVDTLTATWQACVNDKLRSSFHLSDALMQKCDALAHGEAEHGHTSTDKKPE